MNQLAELIHTGLPSHITRVEASVAANNVIKAWASLLAEGSPVILPGLGRLVMALSKARTGRNPKTGEQVEIQARQVIRFRPSRGKKTRV